MSLVLEAARVVMIQKMRIMLAIKIAKYGKSPKIRRVLEELRKEVGKLSL